MARKYRKCSPEFRDEAVRTVIEDSRAIAQVARELGVNEGTLDNWVNQYRKDHAGDEPPLTPHKRIQLAEAQRELRELRMENEFASTRGGTLTYRVTVAQWHRDRRAAGPKQPKMLRNPRLRRYVQERLAGRVITEHGVTVAGPAVPFTGRNRTRRADRRWAQAWSPEQNAARLRLDFPDDPTMRISHEAIYQALYIEGRGGLSREYVACLRTGRALRVPAHQVPRASAGRR